jgi:predicted nuclease of predicted toxin-antitoxin system
LKFLLDVNVGSRIAQALVAAGHDVVRLVLIEATAEDADILDMAVEGGSILVTYDRDFSELVFSRGAEPPPAIVYVRYRARDVEAVIERLLTILDFSLLDNHMTVIDPVRIRRAPFPERSNDHA